MFSLISLLVIAMVMVSITGTHANQQLGGKHILPMYIAVLVRDYHTYGMACFGCRALHYNFIPTRT